MNLYVYDLETFLNCFLFIGKFFGASEIQTFEISDRINERDRLLQWLNYLQSAQAYMVGYNNLPFDYPILHQLLSEPWKFDAKFAYLFAQQIISSQDDRGFNQIRMKDRIIPQIDLLKVHHFDNVMKRTRLKDLQFAMRVPSVEDLPYSPHEPLTFAQMDELRSYGGNDIFATDLFCAKSLPAIKMRKELFDNGILFGDVLNYSDVKIGTEYLVNKIGRTNCYIKGSNPRQSLRSSVPFKEIILPKIQYRTEPFQRLLEWVRQQTIYIGRDGKPPKYIDSLGGLEFHFGVGGIHASVKNRSFQSTDTHVIRDVDVSGMYPAVVVANGFAPEHLGQAFTVAYRQLKVDRDRHPKGTNMNLVLKLAGNGVSGNFENVYSPFYDPKCAYSLRINGQLQLLQLAELFSLIPGVELIQANTDGITALVPRAVEPFFDLWCKEWEQMTLLKLEYATYDKMFIRDVNNYIAVDTKGKIKRKGAYWYPVTEDDYHGSSGSNWNKDFSNITAQKGAEYCLLHGLKPYDVVRLLTDRFDFMLRCKVRSSDKVFIGNEEQGRTVRYYVSKSGQPMKKISPPTGELGTYKRKNGISNQLWNKVMNEIPAGTWDERIHTKNKSRYEEKSQAIESGFLVKNCNRADDFCWSDVDFDYYEKEIIKLMLGAQP